MQNYFIFEDSELKRIGLVCPDCNTEATFDVAKDQAAIVSRSCPGCGRSDLARTFSIPQRSEYNWVTWFLAAMNRDDGAVGIRLYFERSNATEG